MRVDKGEMIMKATTYKELKKWIDEGVDLAELAQGYADKVQMQIANSLKQSHRKFSTYWKAYRSCLMTKL